MFSVFTSRVTDTITLPSPAVPDGVEPSPAQTVTIRKLAPRHLHAAAQSQQLSSMGEYMGIVRAIGGAAALKELNSISDDDIKAATTADPLLTYDRVTLMDKGITAWTLDEPLPTETEARRAALEDLDDDTQEFVARAILKLAKPSLFQTKPEVEAETKNA